MLSPLIRKKIIETTGLHPSSTQYSRLNGGSINEAYLFHDQQRSFFSKINNANQFPGLFSCEVKGLSIIKVSQTIKVPEIISCFTCEGQQVLIQEMIEQGERTNLFWKNFGTRLAAMHQCTHTSFGLDHSNFMGSIVQENEPATNWPYFFGRQRLSLYITCYNQRLLHQKHIAQFEKLIDRLHNFFPENEPPVLVHGDLWSGNFLCNQQEEPVLIDPAVYYGHAAADLAMTTLFGALPKTFYEAYEYHHPFPPGYQQQWEICNLYPLLIHLLLFGPSYLPAIEKILDRLS